MSGRLGARALCAACAAGAGAIALVGAGCGAPDQWGPFITDAVYGTRVDDWRIATVVDPSVLEDEAIAPLFTVSPDGAIELSVEQAAILALENNGDLRVERLTPVITSTFEDIERGVFDPEVFARGEYFEEEGVEVSRATEENFSTEREETVVEGGIRQRLPTGTDVEIGVSGNRSTSNRSPEQQQVRVGITLTQALLRGFGPAVNLARVRQAQLETVASLQELRGFTEAVVAETESTYWLYTLAARRIRIFEESLEVARQQRTEVEQRIEIGVLGETERASAEAEVAQREQELIDARAQAATLRLRLIRLISPETDDAFQREVRGLSEPPGAGAPIEDVEDRVALAMRERADLAEARVRLEQARLETIVTKNGLLPRLDFFIAFGKTGYADSFPDAVRSLDDSTYDLLVGAEFAQALGNRSARARDIGATATRQQAAEAISNLEQIIRLDVRIAATNVERARQQIGASAATRSLREEALRAENERFRVGQSTSLLVAQAQRDLLESQIAEVDAVIAYRLALIQLQVAEGTLLLRRGLLVE